MIRQLHRQTDRRRAVARPRFALVHRAVKVSYHGRADRNPPTGLSARDVGRSVCLSAVRVRVLIVRNCLSQSCQQHDAWCRYIVRPTTTHLANDIHLLSATSPHFGYSAYPPRGVRRKKLTGAEIFPLCRGILKWNCAHSFDDRPHLYTRTIRGNQKSKWNLELNVIHECYQKRTRIRAKRLALRLCVYVESEIRFPVSKFHEVIRV